MPEAIQVSEIERVNRGVEPKNVHSDLLTID